MATIKSYTDINQSMKLVKILPIESADMHFINDKNAGCVPYLEITNSTNPWLKGTNISPCWSLAALLEIFPKGYSAILSKSFNGKNYFCIIDGKPIETIADNPVDACVALIEKLHELKML